MQLLKRSETQIENCRYRFRHSILVNLFVFCITTVITGFLVYFFIKHLVEKELFPMCILFVSLPMMVLFSFFMFSNFKNSLTSANWLLAYDLQDLYIKYRSYMNSDLPEEDLQVIKLDYDEIASACKVKRTETIPSRTGGSTTQFLTYIDLILKQPVRQELRDALVYEHKAVSRSKGPFKATSKVHHYPLGINGDNILRIDFGSVIPSATKALELLERYNVAITETKKEKVDYTISYTDRKKMEEQIIDLAQRGKIIPAVKVARRAYGMSTTDAKKFVDELLD